MSEQPKVDRRPWATARRNTCRRKVRYADPRAAFREFVRLACDGRWNYAFRVYRCEECGGLHLGHHGGDRARREQFYGLLDRPVIMRLAKRHARRAAGTEAA